MPRSENALVCFDPRLRRDSQVSRILPQILQLKAGVRGMIQFVNQAVRVADTVSESVRTACLFAFRIAKETEALPDMAFELETADGARVSLSTHGRVQSIAQSGDEGEGMKRSRNVDRAAAEPLDAIVLRGLSDVRFRGYAQLAADAAARSLNPHCVHDFLSAPRRIASRWDTDRLFQYFLDHGDEKWIAPVEDFTKLEHARHDLNGHRRVILDFMADAGRLGFCPTQFLRKVLVPQLEQTRDLAGFQSTIQTYFGAVQYLQQLLGRSGGDGTAANLFSLKYFVRTLATQASKLYARGFYDERGGMTEVFQALARSWGEAFDPAKPGRSVKCEAVRAYVDRYLRALVQIEVPYEIALGFERASAHLLRIGETLSGEEAPERLDRLFPSSVRRSFEQLESRAGLSARLLRLLGRHMEVMEAFCEERRFGYRYLSYLSMLGRGAFREPQDVDFYLSATHTVDGGDADAIEAVAFVNQFIFHARDPDERRDLVAFLNASPLLDAGLYSRWKELPESKRADLLDEVSAFVAYALYHPHGKGFRFSCGLKADDLETALTLKLVQTSLFSRSEVLQLLRVPTGRVAPVPAALRTNQTFTVPARRKPVGQDGRIENKHLEFLQGKARVIQALRRARTRARPPDVRLGLIRQAIQTFGDKQKQVAELVRTLPDPARRAKAEAGIRKQTAGVRAFLTFLHQVREERFNDEGFRMQVEEAGLVLLGYDKKFHKAHPELFAWLALRERWFRDDPLALALPPFRQLEGVTGGDAAYAFDQVSALAAAYGTHAEQYFLTLFGTVGRGATPRVSAMLDTLLDALGLDHLVGEGAQARAQFCYQAFRKYQSLDLFDQEKDHLRKRYGGASSARAVTLVCARRSLDRFFGAVGENCTCFDFDEIARPAFIPVRIVDADNDRIEGYVHLLQVRARGIGPVFLLAGIEPKMSYIDYVDARAFYAGVKEAVIAWARRAEVAKVVLAANTTAHSNRPRLADVIAEDLVKRHLVDLGAVDFPKNGYRVSPGYELWSAAAEKRSVAAALGEQGVPGQALATAEAM